MGVISSKKRQWLKYRRNHFFSRFLRPLLHRSYLLSHGVMPGFRPPPPTTLSDQVTGIHCKLYRINIIRFPHYSPFSVLQSPNLVLTAPSRQVGLWVLWDDNGWQLSTYLLEIIQLLILIFISFGSMVIQVSNEGNVKLRACTAVWICVMLLLLLLWNVITKLSVQLSMKPSVLSILPGYPRVLDAYNALVVGIMGISVWVICKAEFDVRW